MKTSKFTEQQIVFALQQAENGVKVAEEYRKIGIHEATIGRTSLRFRLLLADSDFNQKN